MLCQSIFLSNYHRVVDKWGETEAGMNLWLCDTSSCYVNKVVGQDQENQWWEC